MGVFLFLYFYLIKVFPSYSYFAFFLLVWTALSSHKSKFYLSLPIRNCIFCLHIFIKIYCQLYRLGAARVCDTRFSQSGLTKVLGLQVFYDFDVRRPLFLVVLKRLENLQTKMARILNTRKILKF